MRAPFEARYHSVRYYRARYHGARYRSALLGGCGKKGGGSEK